MYLYYLNQITGWPGPPTWYNSWATLIFYNKFFVLYTTAVAVSGLYLG